VYPLNGNSNCYGLYSPGPDGVSESGGSDPDDINSWNRSKPWQPATLRSRIFIRLALALFPFAPFFPFALVSATRRRDNTHCISVWARICFFSALVTCAMFAVPGLWRVTLDIQYALTGGSAYVRSSLRPLIAIIKALVPLYGCLLACALVSGAVALLIVSLQRSKLRGYGMALTGLLVVLLQTAFIVWTVSAVGMR
jgi:hypothetical protein